MMNITRISLPGSGCIATLYASHKEIEAVLGPSNEGQARLGVIEYWSFQDDYHRQAYIQLYNHAFTEARGETKYCYSCTGDLTLIEDLFPGKLEKP